MFTPLRLRVHLKIIKTFSLSEKLRFKNSFSVHTKMQSRRFSVSCGLKSVFEKLRFDRWTFIRISADGKFLQKDHVIYLKFCFLSRWRDFHFS